MYMGTGEESLLLKCLKPRTRASRDAVLPVPAWPTFPQRSLVSCFSFSERIKEHDVLIKLKARLHNQTTAKGRELQGEMTCISIAQICSPKQTLSLSL
uniref:Uncharacterized protein n=1 Tax=Balaenoptera musculus TaxID=9771 RepID=A0A8C0C5J6_BALMU